MKANWFFTIRRRIVSLLPTWLRTVALVGMSFLAGFTCHRFNIFPAEMIAVPLDFARDVYTGLRGRTAEDNVWERWNNGQPIEFWSTHLGTRITALPGVFPPTEAADTIMPLMADNAELFLGKSVLEIGTGSGIISLYAASLGAKKVVSTDIDPVAVRNTRLNAAEQGLDGVIEARLVPESDISAYSVIRPDERFDIIVSNPPYSLDLDAPANNTFTDRGDLGLSIVRGLERHLAPGGFVILLYRSNFYHNVMVKFARHMGYEVRNHNPLGLNRTEAETLFNAYLARLLEREGGGVEQNAIRFDRQVDVGLQPHFLRNQGLNTARIDYEPLLPSGQGQPFRPGIIVIERPRSTAAQSISRPLLP